MISKQKKYVCIGLLFASIVLQTSCGSNNSDTVDESRNPIVSVYGQTLYKSEVDNALLGSVATDDSAAIADLYVRKWIDNVLIYEKARKNIANKDNVNKLVEDYRRSLVINSYQERLLKSKLGQDIPDSKLQEYYNQYQNTFILDEPIIKGLYLKVPIESSELGNFKKWYAQGNERAVENIEKYTLQNALGYEYFYNRWVAFSDIINMIPQKIADPDQFLKNNKNLEVQDSSFVYLLNIKEYRPTGSKAPFEFVKDDLLRIIHERERAGYMEQIREDLYEEALSDAEINFYNK